MTVRHEHFARAARSTSARSGHLVVTESKPWDEQPKAAGTAPAINRKPNGQPATSDDARRLAQRPRRRRRADAELKRRLGELERAHGPVSDEVVRLSRAALHAWRAGDRAAARAADAGGPKDVAAMVSAYELARGLVKDAWSLAAFEAQAGKTAGEGVEAMRARLFGGPK